MGSPYTLSGGMGEHGGTRTFVHFSGVVGEHGGGTNFCTLVVAACSMAVLRDSVTEHRVGGDAIACTDLGDSVRSTSTLIECTPDGE